MLVTLRSRWFWENYQNDQTRQGLNQWIGSINQTGWSAPATSDATRKVLGKHVLKIAKFDESVQPTKPDGRFIQWIKVKLSHRINVPVIKLLNIVILIIHFCFDERSTSQEGMAANFDEIDEQPWFCDFIHVDQSFVSSSFRVTNCCSSTS